MAPWNGPNKQTNKQTNSQQVETVVGLSRTNVVGVRAILASSEWRVWSSIWWVGIAERRRTVSTPRSSVPRPTTVDSLWRRASTFLTVHGVVARVVPARRGPINFGTLPRPPTTHLGIYGGMLLSVVTAVERRDGPCTRLSMMMMMTSVHLRVQHVGASRRLLVALFEFLDEDAKHRRASSELLDLFRQLFVLLAQLLRRQTYTCGPHTPARQMSDSFE